MGNGDNADAAGVSGASFARQGAGIFAGWPLAGVGECRFDDSGVECVRFLSLNRNSFRRQSANPSLEVRQRLKQILEKGNKAVIRKLRAIEALDQIGTPEAR
jgi:hypothetical protein